MAFKQVYGVAQARISVGYQYSSCPSVIWETQTAMLQGFDVDISDIGGWSLDIHHHYNFHEGKQACKAPTSSILVICCYI